MMNANLKEKLYQMFILGTSGGNLQTALKRGLGGVIFFTDDIKTENQFKNLIKEIKVLAKYPLFLSIDQEGGRVERTENLNDGKKYLSAKFAAQKGIGFLKTQTKEIALELKDLGINLNFAPCIDVNTNPENPIIGERAFSDGADAVIKCAEIVTKTYIENGIIPCVKHFPGHGDASVDSHLSLPKIDLSLEEMEKTHIKPFKAAVDFGIRMIMIAHLHCTCFDDEETPASLSKNTIDYLRQRLNFKGVIISDDMVMGAVENIPNTCEKAIKAGVNMFIYRNSDDKTIALIENLAKSAEADPILRKNIEISYEKIIKLKN